MLAIKTPSVRSAGTFVFPFLRKKLQTTIATMPDANITSGVV